ncbi:hypothetical protein JAK47_12450 [Stenotrophomonas maltophilia]|uniref:hypothetical protein n=1 Tax=Stenotrophomonas maltophilia TaxID=40324 RepID=UPI0021C5A208|nr:hypothetical protein [Stenotrophomonas maltophilia]MCU1055340.1 hypothetical protein [Stenotrophomonas maltophilia]
MLNRFAIAVSLAFVPLCSQAQSYLTVTGQWEYHDASRMETDEGLNVCFQLDATSVARNPQLQQLGGALCLSNPSEGAKLLGVVQAAQGPGCKYVAKGTATVVLANVRLLPEDDMYDERIEARLLRVRVNRVTSPLGSDCDRRSNSQGFASINEAIAALGTHPGYAGVSASDFVRIDASNGYAELDASTQMWLPRAASNMLVTYYEGNSGLHELGVYRYEGGRWRNASSDVLPGYTESVRQFKGTNFYLDSSNGRPVLRSLPGRDAWTYANGRFARQK